jgi:tRNA(fMet)-specific endonuclease VapC
MNHLLLDTTEIIEYLRVKDKSQTRLVRLISEEVSFYISIITYAELYAGKSVWENESLREVLETVVSGMIMLPLDVDLARTAGGIRAKQNVGISDAIIAATALENKLTLVTGNTRHFAPIDGLELYHQEPVAEVPTEETDDQAA